MIVGVGIDVVDLGRFARALARTPTLRARLFTDAEQDGRSGTPSQPGSRPRRPLPRRSVRRVACAGGTPRWSPTPSGRPRLAVHGTVAEEAAVQGVRAWHLSLSHDGGIATALVVAEG